MRAKPDKNLSWRRLNAAKDFLPALAILVSLGMCGGCLMEPSTQDGNPVSSSTADPGKALRDAPAPGNSGVPVGCSRIWNEASSDSVLYCPDIRPPKAK